ncbi:MAG: CAP domain-containing protein [Mesorhizobium sp.]
MTPHLIRILMIVASIATPFVLASCRSTTLLEIPGEGLSGDAEDILRRLRAEESLPPLSRDAGLEAAARQQAELMAGAGRMEHTAVRGQDFVTRIRSNGIEGAAAENIAHGNYDMERLFLAWMNSRGHRLNMMDRRFTRFGLASAGTGRDRYFALVVAR